MAKAIPDRWTAYKACGLVIEGTRIICFKVPLKKTVQINNKEINEIWDIQELLSRIPNLGAVIDLTNTKRYYNPLDFKNAGVQHFKILMPGRVLPPESKVKEFMDTVDKLSGDIGDSLIGVHCTHGLNRTGYMVCRYMRDRMAVPGKDAIKRFERARGYQIERENYIADILGKKPPPPQFGPHTTVNEVKKRKAEYLSWRRRDEPACDQDCNRNFKNFMVNGRTLQGSKRKRRCDSRTSSSSFEYDYKHDY